MGIKGSSTRQVFFENVAVPVENLLGDIGKGHLIAFNVLNIGRYKLGALCLGGAQGSADTAIKYANERVQFGQAISNFGAIKYKIAEQAIRIFPDKVPYTEFPICYKKERGISCRRGAFCKSKIGGCRRICYRMFYP